MEFRLVYHGRLPAASQSDGRASDKHRIRKIFHPQLKELWNTHPALRMDVANLENRHANNYVEYGYRFVPLVSSHFNVCCSLDILFLRRDQPGNLIRNGGDIDNRIKVLFDALRKPNNSNELAGAMPANDEDPFFCLLEDDRLITQVNVTTDRLLTPAVPDEGQNDIHLIIHVATIALRTPTL